MFYFGYASNLDPDQMRSRAPGHRVVGLAALRDHQLQFPRFSNDWGGGTASPAPRHGPTVWGIVFEVGEQDLAALDRYEGFKGPGDQHNHYDRADITVELTRPDDGSIPRRLRAHTYIARASNPSPPSRRYLDTILKGARHHRLPEEYIASLAAIPVAPEPAAPESAPPGSA